MAAGFFSESLDAKVVTLVPYNTSCFEFSRIIRGKEWTTTVDFDHSGTPAEKKELVQAIFSYALERTKRELPPSITLYPWKGLQFKINDTLSIDFDSESFQVFAPLLHDDEMISVPLKSCDMLLLLNISDRTRLKWTRELWDLRKTVIRVYGLEGGPN